MDEPLSSEAPRVGDGVMTLDAAARVEFASPNAVNAMHRLGVYRAILGASLDELGVRGNPVPTAYADQIPVSEELELGDVAVFIRCIPLLDQERTTGAVVLVRDVTDLRRRDRLLMGKDVAIREVHHRVKNNLQTISSLLRLQSRRLPKGEARHALEEAERRVRSIAVVHENPFSRYGRRGRFQRHPAVAGEDGRGLFGRFCPGQGGLVRRGRRNGRAGSHTFGRGAQRVGTKCGRARFCPATPASGGTAVRSGQARPKARFARRRHPSGRRGQPERQGRRDYGRDQPEVHIAFVRHGDELFVQVRDNGIGLPPGFSIDGTTSLGLSIVRGLVNSQLGGTIEMYNDGGTVVELVIPVDRAESNELARI